MNLYDVLGVACDATQDQIKQAYRKLAQQHHPDKGGDKETFQALQAGYDVLSNPERRKQYDETGSIDPITPEEEIINNTLSMMVLQALDNADVDHSDVVGVMRGTIKNKQAGLRADITSMRRELNKREKALKRFVFKGQGNDILAQAVSADIERKLRSVKAAEDDLEIGEKLLAALNDHSYTVNLEPKFAQGGEFRTFLHGSWAPFDIKTS